MADISKIHINPTGGDHNIKDATARNAIQSSKTLKSSVVTVNDAAPINAEDITVDITPVQDLHGYDKPWAGGAWKNKLPLVLADLKSINTAGTWSGNVYSLAGVTVTVNTDNADNVLGFVINNITTQGATFVLKQFDISVGNYIVNLPSSSSFDGSKFSMAISGLGSTKYISCNNATNIEPSSTTTIRVTLECGSGVTFSNLTVQPMIRLATETDATFAPYSNICPIEGRTGAELDRVGKNLCDDSQNIRGYYNDSGNFVDSVQNKTSDLISVKSNTTYIASIFNKTTLSRVGGLVWTEWDKNGNFIQQKTSESITTNEDTSYVRVRNFNSDSSLITNNNYLYQVELGSTATTYEPYQGQQYTASFGETVHGGKWHVTAGGTDKTHGYLTENSIDGVSIGTSGGGLHWYDISLYSVYNANALISNMLVEMSGDDAWYSSNACMSVNSNGKIRLYFKSSTTADAKTELNGLQIVYKLATPTTISTPKQNVPMLQGINTVSADCGDTSLKYQPDNVIGELKGEIQRANSFVSKMALREGSGAKDFSYGGWSFRLYIYRSMGQISMSVERISASSVTEQAVIKTFNGESDYRAPEYLRPIFDLIQAATYTTPSGWAIQVYLKDDGYIMFTGMAPAVGASAPTSSNWNLVEPWATHQQAKDLFNN